MENLNDYASIAEIFGALAIIVGAVFAFIQFNEFRRRRRNQVAAELCRQFSEPELARAVTLIRHLPDGLSSEAMAARGIEYEEAAQITGMAFETMGLLVHQRIASFSVVQQLTGGLLLMMWRKMSRWVDEIREESGNPRFGEWMQWLAERVEEQEGEIAPAYEAHRSWKPGTLSR